MTRNDKFSEIEPPSSDEESVRRSSGKDVLKKNFSIDDTYSDSSSDDSLGGGRDRSKRLSHASYQSSKAYRKRTHNEMYDQGRSQRRENSYRSRRPFKYSSHLDRSPRDYDHYVPRKKSRYSTGHNPNANPITFDSSLPSYSSVVPRLNTFKEFVLTLDDSVIPDDAVNAYYEYLKRFSNDQLEPFFNNYKNCDWLMLKFHPHWKQCEANFIRKCIQLRLNVFVMLHNLGLMQGLVLDSCAKEVYYKLRYFLVFSNILLECGTMDELNQCKDRLIEKETTDHHDTSSESSSETSSLKLSPDFTQEKIRPNFTNDYNVDGRHHVVGFNIRAIPVEASRDEIYDTYKDIEGFLRAYLSEPNLGRKDFRRAYLTFKSDVDVREVTNKINSIKFRGDITLYVRPNYEQSRRVKCEELSKGTTHTLGMLMYDVHFVCELIEKLDSKYNLFGGKVEPIDKNFVMSIHAEPQPEEEGQTLSTEYEKIVAAYDKLLSAEDTEKYDEMELPPANPILQPLLELRQQLLSVDSSQSVDVNHIKRTLDPAILYLRVVHSVDYYALTNYPCEHLRNLRCSTITIRSWTNNTANTEQDSLLNVDEQMLKFSDEDVLQCYKDEMSSKLNDLVDKDENEGSDAFMVTELKDVEKEVESFIETNTQKITDEKFLCPLSMKKFKSPEFVRKHILAKHADKLLQLRVDVEYFNNFVRSRIKNFPFGVKAFKKRDKSNGDQQPKNYTHTRPIEPASDSLNASLSHLSVHSNSHTSKHHSKSYGRYHDIDVCDSMFDL